MATWQTIPEKVEAFQYGVDQPPDWFDACVKRNAIKAYASNSGTEYYIVGDHTTNLKIFPGDYVFYRHRLKTLCLPYAMTESAFKAEFEPEK